MLRSPRPLRVVSWRGADGVAVCGLAGGRDGLLAATGAEGRGVWVVLGEGATPVDADAVERWARRALEVGAPAAGGTALPQPSPPALSPGAGALLTVRATPWPGGQPGGPGGGPPGAPGRGGTVIRAAAGDAPGAPEVTRRSIRRVAGATELASAAAALRAEWPSEAASAAGAFLVLDRHEGSVAAYACLGPPAAGVFIPLWPGLPVGPDLAGGFEGPPLLGALASAVARGVEAGELAAAEVRQLLDPVETASFAEGAAAEAMAQRLDRDGDDAGSLVRRVVATAHAARIATRALRSLARRDRPAAPVGYQIEPSL